MNPIVRSILAVLVGAVVASLVVAGVEALGHLVYPPPVGLGPENWEAVRAYVETMPVGAMWFVLAAWAVGTFTGAFVAAWLAGRAPVTHGLVIGVIYLLAGIANLVMLPHPLWFAVVAVAIFLPSAYLGSKLVSTPAPAITPQG